MRLNPTKCTEGKFLRKLVTQKGIEANSAQLKVLIDVPSPRSQKDVQRLNGRVTPLNIFITRSSDKCYGFFKILKRKTSFEWTDECKKAFNELKSYLGSLYLLVKPNLVDVLYLYLAVLDYAVSSVLVKSEGKEHKLIFYTSKVLLDVKTQYSCLEKLIYAYAVSA